MSITQATTNVFRLTLGEHTVVGRPTYNDIHQTLLMLDQSSNGRLVLECGPQRFLKCSGSRQTGYQLEYCEGGRHRHFRSISDSIESKLVVELFSSYVQEDNRWKGMIPWVPVDDSAVASGDRKSMDKKKFRLLQREGNTLVINKKFCLMAGGLLLNLGGVACFFLMDSSASQHTYKGVGTIMAIGFTMMVVSGWVDD